MKPILVDTSKWIHHFQGKSAGLVNILDSRIVMIHDFVIGELSLGHFKSNQRIRVFEVLSTLRRTVLSSHDDVFVFVRRFKLQGKEIGWIDAHLLHACATQGFDLLTDVDCMLLRNKFFRSWPREIETIYY